jgi:lysophospholipase L1-like esterase
MWDYMMTRFAKAGRTINARLMFKLSILVIFLLAGCGGYGDIPIASVLSSGRITLSWNDIPGAASYDIYMSTSPGVTTLNSYKISDVTAPITITDLEPGTTYYFMVAVFNDSGESRKSKEVSFTVADTEGFIDFGDLIGPSEPENKSLQSAKSSVSSSAAEQSAVKKTAPPGRPDARDKAGSEVIICFGDSLTSGIGAAPGQDYPSQLAAMIGKPVVNKGIPGDTTASALRRLNRDVLSAKPDIVLITLGGNDLKNGVAKNIAFGHLKYIVEAIQDSGAKVIIGGLKFPGLDRGFGQGYVDLAKQTGATLIPDIFDGIVDNSNLMSDPIHPNNAGYRIIAQRFYNALRPVGKTDQAVSKKSTKAATKKSARAATKEPAPTAEAAPLATKKTSQTVAKKSTPAAAKRTPATTQKTASVGVQKSSSAVQSSVPGTREVTLAWDDVPAATSYNIYWSDKPGVTRQNGTKIGNAKNPYKLKGLIKGKKYYFVVTAVNQSGESSESEEFSFTVGE